MKDHSLITLADVNAATLTGRHGLCRRGLRAWAKANRIDWAEFIAHGVPIEALLATGDALAADVVRQTLARREAGNGQR
ncbi:MAG: hypothetical protein LBR88_07355 [Zoogloeaceae bacterium]|jgi:hypothetical protein|nr:hypothetical protein [Zoogloeaceae bacterium]